MAEPTVPTGSNGRGPNGQFGAGNTFAKGNPLARQAQLLRATLLRVVDEKALEQAALAVLKKACEGDVIAFRELCDRVLGRPAQTDVLQRIEALEEKISGEPTNEHSDTDCLFGTVPPDDEPQRLLGHTGSLD